MPSRRRLARIVAVQALFEADFRQDGSRMDAANILQRNMREQPPGKVDAVFAESLLNGVIDHMEDIKISIHDHAPQWPLDRMDSVTRAILMVSAYEILFGGDAPPAVVMNEAIDIAKEYGGSESGKFVNGVLNAIAHEPE